MTLGYRVTETEIQRRTRETERHRLRDRYRETETERQTVTVKNVHLLQARVRHVLKWLTISVSAGDSGSVRQLVTVSLIIAAAAVLHVLLRVKVLCNGR